MMLTRMPSVLRLSLTRSLFWLYCLLLTRNLSMKPTMSVVYLPIHVAGVKTTFASGFQSQSLTGLAVDSIGNVFVADRNSGNIYKYTSAGVQSLFATGFTNVNGIALDSSNNLFVTEYNVDHITKITPGGAKSIFASGLGQSCGCGLR